MSAYDKINNYLAPAIRKLSDYHIFTQGRKLECTRLTRIPDVWGNVDSETISVSTIQAIFVFPPGEMPLIRLRSGNGTYAQTQATSLFFYDILPTEIYVRWEDKIEIGDIVYFCVKDENDKKVPVVFKILDQKGTVSSQVIWRKMLAAPVTNLDTEIPEDLKDRLTEMLTDTASWAFSLVTGELLLTGEDDTPASFSLTEDGELVVEELDLPTNYSNWRVEDGRLVADSAS